MIEGLFDQTNYTAAKKLLDMTALRHQAIAGNLANLETPGYRRMDVPRDFESRFRSALATKDISTLKNLRPHLAVDTQAFSGRPDGNTVQLERELMELSQNAMEHSLGTQLVTGALLRLRLAITGRSA